MTKLRPPLSTEYAIQRIADLLTYRRMAELLSKPGAPKSERVVRDYGDPDVSTGLTLEQVEILDNAFAAAGGEGHPITDSLKARLDVAAQASPTGHLADLVITVFKESGDAGAALVAAIRPGATPIDRAIAVREVDELVDALNQTRPALAENRVSRPGGACASGVHR